MSIKLGDHPNLIVNLISVLNDLVQNIHIARIFLNLRAYTEADCVELGEITATLVQVEECIQYRVCSMAKQFHAIH